MKTKNQTPKMKQPTPLQVIYPTPLTPKTESSLKKQQETPNRSEEHESSKRKGDATVRKSSSKRAKVNVQVSAKEISKEMIVGFGLDKQWYESNFFPQFHAILQNQAWESLMGNYCCNPMYPNLMREFALNFSFDHGVCTSEVKGIKIEFNNLILGGWLGVPSTGFDRYVVGSKINFSGINEKLVWKFLGLNEKKGKVSHNVLSPMHKLLYNIARRFILPRTSKRSEVSLRDATLIYCLANHIKINFPSLMICHLNDCIFKRNVLGYGGLLTWIFKKLGVPLDGPNYPMGPNNKVGVKCLKNLRLRLTENGTLENIFEQSEDTNEEEEVEENVEEEEVNKEEQEEPVPSATEKAEGHSEEEEQEENSCKGEVEKELVKVAVEEEEKKNEKGSSPGLTPRKSRRLASKGKKPVVVIDDDSTSYTTAQPSQPSSPRPATPSYHKPSPPQSPIRPSSPPKSPIPSPSPVPPSPHQGLGDNTVPTAPLSSILLKVTEFQSSFLVFKDEICVSIASLSAQMDQIEARLGAKLDTVEVETEYIDDEAPAS